jgi:hypothetical protein
MAINRVCLRGSGQHAMRHSSRLTLVWKSYADAVPKTLVPGIHSSLPP